MWMIEDWHQHCCMWALQSAMWFFVGLLRTMKTWNHNHTFGALWHDEVNAEMMVKQGADRAVNRNTCLSTVVIFHSLCNKAGE